MSDASTRLLYGTSQAPPRLRRLTAGPLSALLDSGNLRTIRFGDTEVIRGISFLVRSGTWGTVTPDLRDLRVEETAQSFTVTYSARVQEGTSSLGYIAQIDGHADGRLECRCEATAETDFETCRTGFVVLHPIAGVAGERVRIEQVDGTFVEGRFPRLIDPVQPMRNLRALTHEPVDRLTVTCRLDGDTFEMEDQRNWTDASFKTYSRPLALPWPFTLSAGERLLQTVTMTLDGPAPFVALADAGIRVRRARRSGPCRRSGLVARPTKPRRRCHTYRPYGRRGCPCSSAASTHGRGMGRPNSPATAIWRRASAPRSSCRWLSRRSMISRPIWRGCGGCCGRPACTRRCHCGACRRPGQHTAGFSLAAVSAARRRVPRREVSISRHSPRRRHVHAFHRTQPQATAARPDRLRHLLHLGDRTCRRRPFGDGDDRGPAGHRCLGAGYRRISAVRGWAERDWPARQLEWTRGRCQPARGTTADGRPRPTAAWPVQRRLDPRLRVGLRTGRRRPYRCLGASRRFRHSRRGWCLAGDHLLRACAALRGGEIWDLDGIEGKPLAGLLVRQGVVSHLLLANLGPEMLTVTVPNDFVAGTVAMLDAASLESRSVATEAAAPARLTFDG